MFIDCVNARRLTTVCVGLSLVNDPESVHLVRSTIEGGLGIKPGKIPKGRGTYIFSPPGNIIVLSLIQNCGTTLWLGVVPDN